MNKYGIPYRGSKSQIADMILEELPAGSRFVDLFGGGFAMSHAAMLSGKWKSVYYNDIDNRLLPFIENAIAGKYDYAVFTPEFITKELFLENYLTDGYTAFIGSFGNDGKTYMYGKNIEPIKHAAQDYIVFNRYSSALDDILPEPYRHGLHGDDITTRRFSLMHIATALARRAQAESAKELRLLNRLHQLERIQQLHQLERIHQLHQLELHSHDYRDYRYRYGDTVYCDPPYEKPGTKQNSDYLCQIDLSEFFDYAAAADFPIFFSCYEISDNRFYRKLIYRKRQTMDIYNQTKFVNEYLYSNAPFEDTQLSL